MKWKAIAAFLLVAPVGTASDNWPSFRGLHAAGVSENQNLPSAWDVPSGDGLLFKTPIPGLAHSSPIIWGDHVFLTTAVSGKGEATFTPGLYGAGTASADRSVHEWRVLCIHKKTGRTLWEQTAHKGRPQDKRHIKSTYASSTPATDGKHVVAFFGSEGVFCFSTDGKPLWKAEVGRLNAGAYDIKSYEWGTASSPIIHNGRVYVQCDTQDESFVLALDVETGDTLWRTPRDELPSWGTPTIYPDDKRPELITNGSNFIRGYNPLTGKELWRLGGSSKITAPTPVFADGVIIVASGRSPERPIFAIRPGASGDITLENDEKSNASVIWSRTKRGPYMPTPLIYRGKVYTLGNSGLFGCYELKTGEEHYYERIPHRAHGFSGSPVAADSRIYLPGEDGLVFVVQAGTEFKLLSTHKIGEPLMATPAISDGMLYLRGQKHLFAIGKPSQ